MGGWTSSRPPPACPPALHRLTSTSPSLTSLLQLPTTEAPISFSVSLSPLGFSSHPVLNLSLNFRTPSGLWPSHLRTPPSYSVSSCPSTEFILCRPEGPRQSIRHPSSFLLQVPYQIPPRTPLPNCKLHFCALGPFSSQFIWASGFSVYQIPVTPGNWISTLDRGLRKQ